jgi:hypothetical protein
MSFLKINLVTFDQFYLAVPKRNALMRRNWESQGEFSVSQNWLQEHRNAGVP